MDEIGGFLDDVFGDTQTPSEDVLSQEDQIDLTLHVFTSYIVFVNDEIGWVDLKIDNPTTLTILQKMSECKLSKELIDLLKKKKNFTFNKGRMKMKIIDERIKCKVGNVEHVTLHLEDEQFDTATNNWIKSNYDSMKEREKERLLAEITNKVNTDLCLNVDQESPNEIMLNSNILQYEKQKRFFRRRRKVKVKRVKFPFTLPNFKGIKCPPSKVQFVYPHSLYKYVVETKKYDKYLKERKKQREVGEKIREKEYKSMRENYKTYSHRYENNQLKMCGVRVFPKSNEQRSFKLVSRTLPSNQDHAPSDAGITPGRVGVIPKDINVEQLVMNKGNLSQIFQFNPQMRGIQTGYSPVTSTSTHKLEIVPIRNMKFMRNVRESDRNQK